MKFYVKMMFVIVCLSILVFIYIRNLKNTKSVSERVVKILLLFVLTVPFVVFLLDKYNIPTKCGYTNHVDSDRWFSFVSQYVSGIIGTILSGCILFLITRKQIESQIYSDNENKRIANAPVLKYNITNQKIKCDYDEFTFGEGRPYNLYFEIENCGLNHARHLKFELYIEGKKRIESHIRQQQSILKKDERITFNLVIDSAYDKENIELNRKKAQIVVYYKDLLNNSYIQTINLVLCMTNYSGNKFGGYECDIVKVEIDDESLYNVGTDDNI